MISKPTLSPYLTIGAFAGVLSALFQHAGSASLIHSLFAATLGAAFGALGAAAYVVVRDRVVGRPRTP